MPKLLILTLSSGEAALPVLTGQLQAQTFRDFEHEIISGLPNQAAHNHLYRMVMARASSFELFLKLDADMTLRSATSLADAVCATHTRPGTGHFAFQVWDCFTEEETLGVHIFRSGVSWGEITDDLFVDPDPPNVTQILWQGPPAPFVNHGEVVSDFECFAFGAHKFLKAVQRGRGTEGRPRKRHKYLRHMRNCIRIRELYRVSRARRHLLALAGVMWAMEQDAVAALPDKMELERIFTSDVAAHEAAWRRRVERLATSRVAWRLALLRTVGARRAFAEAVGA